MSIVKSVEFSDYKAFSNFTLSARERNVLVGPNNAGKSTSLDAFRITFDILRFISRRNAVLKSQGADGVCSTWMVPTTAVQNDLRSCVHNFGDGRARITIRLENGNALKISLSSEGDVECYLDTDALARKNTSFLREKFPLNLVIVPTLSPLEQNEEIVLEETVERNRYSRLASRNFRSFWYYRSQPEFESFADLVEIGWPGIRLMRPEIERTGARAIVRMYFRDGVNVREVQWSGFGFQVWMQTMTHLTFADSSSTLILDEPDIYLHPDLQHRLLRIVGKRVSQYFIATHSTEIINDVDPSDILIVRPDARSAKRIQGETGYADVYSVIGSSENAQFARLAKTRKVLYFEGNDARILSKIAKKLAGFDFISNSSVTLMKTDGFSNWSKVTTSSWVFAKFFGFKIPVAAIFDRDYRQEDEVTDFLSGINNADTMCRVLPFKEIENVLIVNSAIRRVVRRFSVGELHHDWERDVDEVILACMEDVKLKTLSARIGARISYEVSKRPRVDVTTISMREEKEFTEGWADDQFRRRVVPGKSVFSDISGRIQQRFSVTITASRVIDEMSKSDVSGEIFTLLNDIRIHLME